MKIPLFLFTFMLIQTTLFSQLRIDVQYRPRLEFRDGYQQVLPEGEIPTILTSQRTRLSLGYHTENLKIKFTPQDVRVWGDEQNANMTAVFGDEASLDLYEAYVGAKIKNSSWLYVGRQQVSYDNEWLLSARNWNQNGNSVDAVVFKAEPEKFKLHLGLAWNTYSERISNNYFPSNKIKSMNFLWFNRDFGKKFNMSLLYLATGVTKNDTSNVLYFRHTTGLYGNYSSEHFASEFNAYYQNGVSQTGREVSAFLGAADIKYITDNFHAGASLAYLSGNKHTGGEMTVDNLFDNIHGARHRYFGFMDYFRIFSTNTRQGGLIDYAITLNYKFSKKLSVRNITHLFQLAQTNNLTGNDPNLGIENDFIVIYKVYDWGGLELGYCIFKPSETLKAIQNVSDNKLAQFAYVQFTVNTTVFK